MPHLSIDAAIFGVFLAVNLIVGLIYGQKVKTLRDYAIGDKNFATLTIAATIVATWATGSAFTFYITQIYSHGLVFIIVTLSSALALYIVGKVAIRVGEFLNTLSVAEAMGSLYGPSVRNITAVCGIAKSVGYIAVQFKVSSIFLQLIFNLDSTWATVVASGIVILYSTFGGIKAVTFTDVLQFLTFSLLTPILALIIWKAIKDPTNVITIVTKKPIFSIKLLFNNPRTLSTGLSFVLFNIVYVFDPPIFQRIMLARDVLQVKKAFNYATVLWLVIILFFIWISILLLTADDTIPPNDIMRYIINNYLSTGFKGFMAVGVMAMVMSTADSYINSAAVLFSNDLSNLYRIPTENKVLVARFFAFSIGVGALILALSKYDFSSLVFLTASFYVPIVTVPLALAIYGFRSSTKSVLIGMVAGLVTVLVWRNTPFLANTGSNSAVPGMLGNFIFLIGSHYLLKQPGGWVGIKEPAPLAAEKYINQRSRRLFFFFC